MTLVDRVAQVLERHSSRRGFLVKSALVGSALAVGPVEFILRPGTAYAVVCRCANPACGCGSPCCDGYTEFCCTLHGSNTCPSGTFAGGWWKADGSTYCAGPRYYVDCHSECQCDGGCRPGGFPFCGPGCDGLDCGCAHGNCANRSVGCVSFRYGQCHQEIACAGRIACRVVTCTPAYLFDDACTTTSLTDNNTRQHNAPCLQAPPRVLRAYGLAAAPGNGLWLVGPDGGVFAFGGAPFLGSMGGRPLDAPVVGMAAAPDGQGYWLVASDGGIFSFGSAIFHGSAGGSPLASPVVGMAPAPDGQGYWLVASDGGIFNYGSATYHGSMGGQPLNALIGGVVPTPTGAGYWLWGQDGAVYTFGDAPFLGSYRTLLPNPQPPLPAVGIDAFYGLVPQVGPGGAVLRYTLSAVSRLGPPPTVISYPFVAPAQSS